MQYTKETLNLAGREIDTFRIENDINGNPRFVVHFLSLLTESEKEQISAETNALRATYPNQYFTATSRMFDAALRKSRKIGGQKYRGKWFGGGIVFQSYCLKSDLERLFS
tara:strand:- start:2938 stop:3267 length:330 start_codon:yes stop_codon:yes gene_type:complete